ncbi:MAG: C69 family dipeptidase [Holophagae bacterium]|nr:C69 family dipeptidase [Holophagae bacterium]
MAHRVRFVIVILAVFVSFVVFSCTNMLVSKGASADGSVMITYTCDGEFHPHMRVTLPADHKAGEMISLRGWDGKVKGEIDQVPHTCGVVGLMNEFQVVIGETTFDGRKELQNPDGLLHYWYLMKLALERSRTAREAVNVITGLVEKYGYASTGESFSIADKKEAWLLEMIGSGKGGKGAIWVARRIPDGYVCAHANASVIGEFPMDDKENCLYSKNVVNFAVEKGYYDPKSGVPFRFNEVYCPMTPQKIRYTATRVWSIFKRCTPSLSLSPDFHRGVKDAVRYPLWIKPDHKLTMADVMALMRDHYEGTPYDMTRGVDSGPFHSPQRWRPMNWRVAGNATDYTWERPISTQQTGFSFVSQSRDWLPDPVGGVYWYGLDNTYTSCYTPFYCASFEVPEAYSKGSLKEFSMDSAWWVFNLVSNFAEVKWSSMVKDILVVQKELEERFIAMEPAVDQAAATLFKKDPKLAVRYLNDYSNSQAMTVYNRWVALSGDLICKYNDGYVKNEKGRAKAVGYPEDWLETVHGLRPEQFKLPKWDEKKMETELPF